MMTSSGDNNGRVGVWVCSPTKLKQIPKIPKAEQETAQPTAARFKNRRQLEPRPPTAARLINRRQSKKPRSRRLGGLKNKPKAEQETAQPMAARFKKN